VNTAGVAGMFEIESSNIAIQKAKNGEVKSFAERMIADHTKAAEELKITAQSTPEKFAVPDKLDAKHQKLVDELDGAASDKFDAAYVRLQTDAHKEAVKLFESYAKQGDNEALKAFAAKTLPTLKDHYQMIQKIAASHHMAGTEQPATNQTEIAETTASTASNGFAVSLPSEGVMMGSNFIGSTVYSLDNENVGDVNDIVIDKSGRVLGIVVGVGGFLGIGEKDVLVPIDRITVMMDENKKAKYTINATRDELDNAAAFDRAKWTNNAG
jgi:putative membrane protein